MIFSRYLYLLLKGLISNDEERNVGDVLYIVCAYTYTSVAQPEPITRLIFPLCHLIGLGQVTGILNKYGIINTHQSPLDAAIYPASSKIF